MLSPTPDGRERGLDELSEGQTSLFFLALAATLAQLESELAKGTPPQGFTELDVAPAALTIYALEEPENHLAPFYLSRLMALLAELCAGHQAMGLVTSHAPSALHRVGPEAVRDAAKNLKDRVVRRCPAGQARRFDSYTFDAFAKSFVDRFLALTPAWCRPPRDYRIIFPTRDDWDNFLRGLTPPDALGGIAGAQALRREAIERWGPLPLELGEPADVTEWVAIEWWRRSLSSQRPGISFPMVGRLAQATLTHNPDVLRALRLTYSHVFLDETPRDLNTR